MDLLKQLKLILETKELITALSNTSALLNQYFDRLNWVGFYLYKDNHLILGPFQGKVACETIEIGKGVCGTSLKELKVLNVSDVHAFPGHIACDSASNSEIVLPLYYNDQLFGVLDIDSPYFDRFSKEDEELLKEVASLITKRFIAS